MSIREEDVQEELSKKPEIVLELRTEEELDFTSILEGNVTEGMLNMEPEDNVVGDSSEASKNSEFTKLHNTFKTQFMTLNKQNKKEENEVKQKQSKASYESLGNNTGSEEPSEEQSECGDLPGWVVIEKETAWTKFKNAVDKATERLDEKSKRSFVSKSIKDEAILKSAELKSALERAKKFYDKFKFSFDTGVFGIIDLFTEEYKNNKSVIQIAKDPRHISFFSKTSRKTETYKMIIKELGIDENALPSPHNENNHTKPSSYEKS